MTDPEPTELLRHRLESPARETPDCLDDATLAGRLRTAGYQVCARFTWDRTAAEHQRIYADLKWR